jgi:HTH-type transcriptional regulator / antitoxin HigA
MLRPSDVTLIPNILFECGLRFIIVEGLPNAKIDGVCLWLDTESPVIAMSTRLDRIDNFWFVLWHELAHVMNKDGKDGPPVIDVELEGERASGAETANVSRQEARANSYAADKCIPADELVSFTARRNNFFSERDILYFADRMKVHPGIVIGHIHNRTGKYQLLRKYLVKVREYVLPVATKDGWGYVAPVTT